MKEFVFDGTQAALDYLAENYRFDDRKAERVYSDLRRNTSLGQFLQGDSSFFVHTGELCLLRHTGEQRKPEYTLYVHDKDSEDARHYRYQLGHRYNSGGVTFLYPLPLTNSHG